jgi:hypothetical protein
MIAELERRREQLRARVADAARRNQAARAAELMGRARRGTVAMIVALAIALGAGAAIGAIYFPTVQLYVQTCP